MAANPAVEGLEAFQRVDRARSAERVAQRNPRTGAARKSDRDGGAEQEPSAMHCDACEHEDGLIGDPRTDDSKRESRAKIAKYP